MNAHAVVIEGHEGAREPSRFCSEPAALLPFRLGFQRSMPLLRLFYLFERESNPFHLFKRESLDRSRPLSVEMDCCLIENLQRVEEY